MNQLLIPIRDCTSFKILLLFFAARNPFEQHPPNPFQAAAKNQKPAMNQLLQQQTSPWQNQTQQQQQQQQQQDFNPFF